MRIEVIGNVTRDPELRFTPSGVAVCSFAVAVNRRWKDRSGDWKEETDWSPTIEVWGQQGENVAEAVPKGARVMVSGDLRSSSFETRDGQKRTVHKVTATEVGLSLRWATATVARNERRPSATPAQPYAPDEEPF